MHYPKFTIRFKWLPIALFIFSGCQQDEPEGNVDRMYIRFTPEEIATKALPKEVFAEGDKIGIIQYLYVIENGQKKDGTSPWSTKKARITPDQDFYNIQGIYNEKERLLDYGTSKAWSTVSEDKYTFFAYYPYSGSDKYISISGKEKVGAPFLTYELPYTPNTNTPKKHEFSKVKDVMVASNFNHQKKFGTVSLNFTHILSCIDFKIHNLNTSKSIKLTSLSLSGSFYPKVTVDMETLIQSPTERILSEFPFISKTITFKSTLNTGAVSVGELNKNILFIVPITKPTDWEVSAEWQLLDENNVVLSYNNKFTGKIGNGINFLPGKKHTFTLNFLGDVCTIQSNVTDWEKPEGEDNNIEFE